MIEKIVSFIVFILTIGIIWFKTHEPLAVFIFGVAQLFVFLMIWFSDFISENLMPFVNLIWAPMARDFTNYNREGYSLALKVLGWILVIVIFSITFCVKVHQ